MTELNLEDLALEDGLTDEDEDTPDFDGPADLLLDPSPAEAESSKQSGEGEI